MPQLRVRGQEVRITISADGVPLRGLMPTAADIVRGDDGSKLVFDVQVARPSELVALDGAKEVKIKMEIWGPQGDGAQSNWTAAKWRAVKVPSRQDYVTLTIETPDDGRFADLEDA